MALLAIASTSCGNGVASEAAAEAAYLGLDGMIAKTLNLGFDGFNAASSANIPTQMTTGDVMGTLTIDGQVDQGSSDNKGMRLDITLVDYQDVAVIGEEELVIVYNTDATLPYADLRLRNIPTGTLEGTLTGAFYMQGDIEGAVTLSITFSGQLEPDPNGGTVRRVAGSTRVVGTATSDFGVYNIDVTL